MQRYVQARKELGGAPAGRGTAVDGHQRTRARLIAGRLRGLASDEIGGRCAVHPPGRHGEGLTRQDGPRVTGDRYGPPESMDSRVSSPLMAIVNR